MKHRKLFQLYVLLGGLVLVLLIMAIALAGGGGGGPLQVPSAKATPVPVPEYPVVIPETTEILEPEVVEQAVEIGPQAQTLVFTDPTGAIEQRIQVGDVVVSGPTAKAPEGFLRRVVRVVRDAQDRLVIETVPASLTEAVESGTLRIRKRITPADVAEVRGGKLAAPLRQEGPLVVEIPETVLYDADGDRSTTDDQVRVQGHLQIEPTLVIEMGISRFRLQQANAYVETTITPYLQLTAINRQEVDWENEVPLMVFRLRPIIGTLGGLPVVITPKFEVRLRFTGNALAHVEVVVTAEGELDFMAGAGFQRSRGWFPIAEHRERFSVTMDPTLEAQAEAQLSVLGLLTVKLYGLVGLQVGLEPYLYAFMDIHANPWWTLDWGLRVPFAFEVNLLDKTLASYESVVLDFRKRIAQASSALAPRLTTLQWSFGEETPIPETGPATITVLLMDISGSMKDATSDGVMKITAAQEAAQKFLNLLHSENTLAESPLHWVGLVVFNNDANVLLEVSPNLTQAQDVLQNLIPDGGTALAAGLQAAFQILQQAPYPQERRNVLVLSDGVPTVGLYGEGMSQFDPDLYQTLTQQVLEVAQKMGEQGICLYTVGFGEPGISDQIPSYDEDLLRDIAQSSSCGAFYRATNMMELMDTYVVVRHESMGEIRLHRQGVITQGDEVDLGMIDIARGEAYLRFTLTWPGSQLDPILIDPRGRRVDEGYPRATIQTYRGMVDVIVEKPIPGLWKAGLYGRDVPEGAIAYSAVVSTPRLRVASEGAGDWALGCFIAVVAVVVVAGGVWFYYIRHRRVQHVAAQARLVFADGRSIPLTSPEVLIGRSRRCTVRLPDRTVSREHARLRYAQGTWYLQDLGSTGGTYVNGVQIQATRLRDGDRIRIGDVEMVFRSPLS